MTRLVLGAPEPYLMDCFAAEEFLRDVGACFERHGLALLAEDGRHRDGQGLVVVLLRENRRAVGAALSGAAVDHRAAYVDAKGTKEAT